MGECDTKQLKIKVEGTMEKQVDLRWVVRRVAKSEVQRGIGEEMASSDLVTEFGEPWATRAELERRQA